MTCPYCAEPIQDAAVFCKHCRRDVPASGLTPSLARSVSKPSLGARLWWTCLAGCICMFGVLKLADASGHPVRVSLPSFRLPRTMVIPDQNALEIPALGYKTWTWTAAPSQTTCTVAGHILVLAGGNKDVGVLVMPADDLSNWAKGRPAKAYFESGNTAAVTLHTTTIVPGTYVLVVSNVFSLVTAKIVQTEGVKVSCT